MLRLAGSILDFTDDSSFIGDSAKMSLIEGRLMPFEKHAQLPDEAFALLIQGRTGLFRRYPVYSKLATALSTEYFALNHNNLHVSLQGPTAIKLAEKCKEFGVVLPEAVSQIVKGTHTKTAADRVIQASSISEADDTRFEDKEALVKHALRIYEDRFHEMNNSERLERATVISVMAEKLGMACPELVTSYSYKTEFGGLYKIALEQRAETLRRQGKDLAVKELEMLMKDATTKTAVERLEAFDTKYALFDHYRRMPDPVRAVFGGSAQKTAMEPMGTPQQDNRAYAWASIIKQYSHELNRILTDRGINALKSNPEQFYKSTSPEMRGFLDDMIESLTRNRAQATVKEDTDVEAHRRVFGREHLNKPRSSMDAIKERKATSKKVPTYSKAK